MSELSLVEFLTARLAEDEAVARFAIDAADEPGWVFHETPYGLCWEIAGETEREDSTGFKWWASVTHDREGLSDSVSPEAGPHIARHDPARVLAEVEAKRRIVVWMTDEVEYVVYADEVLRALASVYSDHPDYRPEWRP